MLKFELTQGTISKTVVLPMPSQELSEVLASLHEEASTGNSGKWSGYSAEYMVTETDAPFRITPYSNINVLNDVLNELPHIHVKTMQDKAWPSIKGISNLEFYTFVIENFASGYSDALEFLKKEIFQFIPVNSLQEVVEVMVDTGYVYGLGIVPKHLKHFVTALPEQTVELLRCNLGWKESVSGQKLCGTLFIHNEETLHRMKFNLIDQNLEPKVEKGTGTVAFFDQEKGYGLIKGDDGDDVFVHFSSLLMEGKRNLSSNQRVSFRKVISHSNYSFEAKDVTVI